MKSLFKFFVAVITIFTLTNAQDVFKFETTYVKKNATGEEKFINIALINPIQIFPESTPITGLRLNLLYGKNTTVKGLDIGFVNHTTSGTSKGWQFGLVGLNDANFTGFQDNAVNLTKEKMEGLQFGVFNYAGSMSGVQIGIVNYSQTLYGLQIGILNFINSGGQFPVFPIVNWSF